MRVAGATRLRSSVAPATEIRRDAVTQNTLATLSHRPRGQSCERLNFA